MGGKPNKSKPKVTAVHEPVQGITQSMLEHVGGVAKSCGAKAVFVYADALAGEPVTFLAVPEAQFELPRGLGAHHQAAAAITAVSDTIAVTVSQSTGTVTIFRGGGIITEIQKPRSVSPRPRSG